MSNGLGAAASNAPLDAPKGETALLGRASNGLGAGASNAPFDDPLEGTGAGVRICVGSGAGAALKALALGASKALGAAAAAAGLLGTASNGLEAAD